MDYSHDATKATQKKLEEAIDAAAADPKASAAYNAEYIKFLEQFETFRDSYVANPTQEQIEKAGKPGEGVQTHNPALSKNAFFIKGTDNKRAEELLDKARGARDVMADVPLADRIKFLEILETKIAKYQDAIMTTITADTGKPIDLSQKEMGKGKEWFDYARQKLTEQLAPEVDESRKLVNERKPKGAVQVIGAFNYPYALAIGGIVGGLGAGNGVIVSAPLKANNWVFPFMQAAKEATDEFADWAKTENKPYKEALEANKSGLIQYSTGINTQLTKEADLVHFVGSDNVGKWIRRERDKPTILELGGNNVVVVMKSGLDVMPAEKIAKTLYDAFGPATGQRCTAPRMIFAQRGAEVVAQKLGEMCDHAPGGDKMGNPFKKGIEMGPLVDGFARDRMLKAIEVADHLKAKVYGRGKVNPNAVPFASQKDSYWVSPVVIDWTGVDVSKTENVKAMQEVFKDEIFGPLVHIVHPVDTLQEAIKKTNELDKEHGLAAAIFTKDDDDFESFKRKVKVTSVVRNGAPKDLSSFGAHGHPDRETIGADGHFKLYSDMQTGVDMTPVRTR